VRVRYADTDQMGVTYYANYLVWFEVGRTDWLRHHGWTYREMERDGIRLPVIEAFCRYLAPARYDDELEVHTRATLVTPARVRFDYEIRVGASGTTAAIGYTTHAALGTSGKPCRLPDRVRLVMQPPREKPSRAGEWRRDGGDSSTPQALQQKTVALTGTRPRARSGDSATPQALQQKTLSAADTAVRP
jgi:acyl-CoA thioester hydrolase